MSNKDIMECKPFMVFEVGMTSYDEDHRKRLESVDRLKVRFDGHDVQLIENNDQDIAFNMKTSAKTCDEIENHLRTWKNKFRCSFKSTLYYNGACLEVFDCSIEMGIFVNRMLNVMRMLFVVNFHMGIATHLNTAQVDARIEAKDKDNGT